MKQKPIESFCAACKAAFLTAEGQVWRAKRLSKDLTLKQVAKRMGISDVQLSNLETGKRNFKPKHRTALRKLFGAAFKTK